VVLLVWAGQEITETRLQGAFRSSAEVPNVPVAVFTDANPWARPGLEQIASEVEQYRLSGTSQTFHQGAPGEETQEQASIALVDDLKSGQQHIVYVGSTLGSFRIVEISKDSIRIAHETRQWTLTLSGQIATSMGGAASPLAPLSREERFDRLPTLEETPYGKRVADSQWVISRAAIKGYAEEIIGSPIRATRLYGSFTQVAEEEGQTESGYRLRMKGEQEFFSHMGLQDDDVIRRVNSMKMKNQGRAEYLVGEFMKDNMGLVVLDIEREGKEQKLIYLIRE